MARNGYSTQPSYLHQQYVWLSPLEMGHRPVLRSQKLLNDLHSAVQMLKSNTLCFVNKNRQLKKTDVPL